MEGFNLDVLTLLMLGLILAGVLILAIFTVLLLVMKSNKRKRDAVEDADSSSDQSR